MPTLDDLVKEAKGWEERRTTLATKFAEFKKVAGVTANTKLENPAPFPYAKLQDVDETTLEVEAIGKKIRFIFEFRPGAGHSKGLLVTQWFDKIGGQWLPLEVLAFTGNGELDLKFPDSTAPVVINVFGGATWTILHTLRLALAKGIA